MRCLWTKQQQDTRLYRYRGMINPINNNRTYNPNDTKQFTSKVPQALYKNVAKYAPVEKTDIWHEYPLKLLVYSNDFGEAVRPVIGNFMARMSWVPSISYTFLALQSKNEKNNLAKELAFQGIASFLLPFLMLKASRSGASKLIDKIPAEVKNAFAAKTKRMPPLDKFVRKFDKNNQSGYKNIAVSGVGIGVLLACVRPIDEAVKKVLDKHLT